MAPPNGERSTVRGSAAQRGVGEKLAVDDGGRVPLLERYERNADLPLMVLSLAVIPLVAVEYLADLRPRAQEGLELTYAVIWLAFVADYVIRLVLSPRGEKRKYIRDEWLDLLLVIVTVPLALSPFAVFRAARAVRLLRVFRFGAVAARGTRRVVTFPKSANSQLAIAAASFVMVTLVSAVLVLAVEEGTRGSQINTLGQSLWWAVSTVTTVGFGDVVPRTTAGRFFALVPMVAGVALVAVVSANFVKRYQALTQTLSRNVAATEENVSLGVERRLEEMTGQIAQLEETIRSSQTAAGG